jgi:uncharacterized membrane protein YbhN (UPF0104 family)
VETNEGLAGSPSEDDTPEAPAEQPAPGWRVWAGRVLKWGLTLLLTYLLCRALLRYYDDYRRNSVDLAIDWGWFGVSLALQTLGYYLFGVAWHAGLRELGGRVHLARSIWLWASYNLWKYVPLPGGKFILPVTRVAAFRPEGCRGALVICAFAVESICMLLVGFVLFALTLPFQAKVFLAPEVLSMHPEARLYPWFCLIALPLLPLLHPRVLEWAVGKALVRMGREPIEFHLTGAGVARILGWWVVAWGVNGFSFYVLGLSVIPNLPLSASVLLSATFAFSWVLAMVSFLTPAGLGVREAALLVLLVPQLSPVVGPVAAGPLAAVLTAGSRVWTTVADGLSIGLAFVVDRLLVRGRPAAPEQD